jgi:hypothetical protein
MPNTATITWLKAATLVLVILGGIVLALGAFPPLSGGARLFADIVFWPLDGVQTVTAPETRLFAAIGGGAFVGMGVMVWLLASQGFAIDPAFTRHTIMAGILGWFVTDSVGSLAAGSPGNALLNVPLMLAFILPLLRSPRARAA